MDKLVQITVLMIESLKSDTELSKQRLLFLHQ